MAVTVTSKSAGLVSLQLAALAADGEDTPMPFCAKTAAEKERKERRAAGMERRVIRGFANTDRSGLGSVQETRRVKPTTPLVYGATGTPCPVDSVLGCQPSSSPFSASSWQSTQWGAHGTAARRLSLIWVPQFRQKPYVPSSIRLSASSIRRSTVRSPSVKE